jgi:hypothetical protein
VTFFPDRVSTIGSKRPFCFFSSAAVALVVVLPRPRSSPEFRVLTNHETCLWSLVHEDEFYRADVN